ncbi:MAG: flagellar biosynthetic protein FliO [Planctomycetota bacterium]
MATANGQSSFVASGGGNQGYVEAASYTTPAPTNSSATSDSNWIRPAGGLPSHPDAGTTPSSTQPKRHTSVLRQAASASATKNTKAKTRLTPPSSEQGEDHSRSSGSSFVSVAASLLLVVGLFLGCTLGYRRWIVPHVATGTQNGPRVLSRTTVGPRQQLAVVEFGPKLVLVSIHQGQMRPLSELTEDAEIAEFRENLPANRTLSPGRSTNGSRAIRTRGGNASLAWERETQLDDAEPLLASTVSKGAVAR